MDFENLKTINQENLGRYLENLGLLEKVSEGRAHCKFCDTVVSVENIAYLLPESGNISFICDKPECMLEASTYLRKKSHA